MEVALLADKIRLDEIKGSVEIGDDHLTILDEYGSEVVHWVVAEVEEDPEVAFTESRGESPGIHSGDEADYMFSMYMV
jgi:hypothetical protein